MVLSNFSSFASWPLPPLRKSIRHYKQQSNRIHRGLEEGGRLVCHTVNADNIFSALQPLSCRIWLKKWSVSAKASILDTVVQQRIWWLSGQGFMNGSWLFNFVCLLSLKYFLLLGALVQDSFCLVVLQMSNDSLIILIKNALDAAKFKEWKQKTKTDQDYVRSII